mgnify:CR=1 FL=1
MVSLLSEGGKAARGYVCIGVLLVGSLALPYLVKTAFSYKAAADVAQRQLADNQRQVDQEAGARAQLVRWQAVRDQWGTLAERGWRTSLWDVRSIEVDNKRFSRREADTLMSSLESSSDSFMLPKSFSIKLVSDSSGSLYIDSPAQDQAGSIQLSLSGDYYSRRVQ